MEPGVLDRVAAWTIAVVALVSVAALLDPLEGGVLIAVAAIPAFVAGHVLRLRARWLIAVGAGLIGAAFLGLQRFGDQSSPWVALLAWLSAVVLVVVGDVLLFGEVLSARRPGAAKTVTIGLLMLVAALVVVVVILFARYQASPSK